MEEKRYPIVEEESSGGKVSEPIAAPVPDTMTAECIITDDDWINDLDWDKFPSFGPFSDEEAIARIEEAERDLNDPSKWITAEEMDRRLYERFPWLR